MPRRVQNPPAWLVVGAVVDYHDRIGGPVTLANVVVRSEPWQLGGGQWVVQIEGKSGGVAIEALTRAPVVKVHIQSFTLEAETKDAKGRVRSLTITGENLGAATLGDVLRDIASASRGGK